MIVCRIWTGWEPYSYNYQAYGGRRNGRIQGSCTSDYSWDDTLFPVFHVAVSSTSYIPVVYTGGDTAISCTLHWICPSYTVGSGNCLKTSSNHMKRAPISSSMVRFFNATQLLLVPAESNPFGSLILMQCRTAPARRLIQTIQNTWSGFTSRYLAGKFTSLVSLLKMLLLFTC